MKQTHSSSEPRRRSGVRAALAGLFLALGVLPAAASTTGGGSTNSSGSTMASGGDDVVGLPVRADLSGITLVGELGELRALQLVVRGEGSIRALSLPSGAVALTFMGDYQIELDRVALARSHVAILFRSGAAFGDGRAQLQLGGSSTSFETPQRLPLPVARLAGDSAVQGDFLGLGLLGQDGHQARILASFGTDKVTLLQRMH